MGVEGGGEVAGKISTRGKGIITKKKKEDQ